MVFDLPFTTITHCAKDGRSMLLIDTNTLYYAAGFSVHASVDSSTIIQAIDEATEVSLSSVSLGEIIAKHKNNADLINSVCSFMLQHHIELRNTSYIPFCDDIIPKLLTINQAELDHLYETLSLRKCYIEAPYAITVFFTVLFCDVIFECNIDPYNVPDCIFEFFSIDFKDSLTPIMSSLIKSTYKDAYATDHAEDYIREAFQKYLELAISLCVPLCKHVIEEYNKIPEGEMVDIPAIISKYSDTNWAEEMTKHQAKIEKKPTPASFIKSKGLAYGKGINDKHLSALLDGLSNSFKKTISVPSLEEYVYSIVRNTISNGGAFRKNDINDALILSTLMPDDKILTFDIRMIEHMEKYSMDRTAYNASIAFIRSIWNYSK